MNLSKLFSLGAEELKHTASGTSENPPEDVWVGDVLLRNGKVEFAIVKKGQQINLSYEEAKALRDALTARMAQGEWG